MLCVSDFSVASAKTDGKNPLKSTELKKHFMEDVYKPGQKHCRDDVMPTAKTNKKNCRSQERLLPAPSFFGRFPTAPPRSAAPTPRSHAELASSPLYRGLQRNQNHQPPTEPTTNFIITKKTATQTLCIGLEHQLQTSCGQGNECTARVSRDS